MRQRFMILLSILLALNLNLFSRSSKTDATKKLEFEVSGGIALINRHDSFYDRISGTNNLIAQYAQYYLLTADISGDEVNKLKTLMPLNLSLNYNISKNWYLKIGFEYSSGKIFTEQQNTVKWNGTTEKYNYNYDYRISSLLPYVGIETRFSSFGIYANVGFNITDFSFTQALRYEENGLLLLDEEETFDTKGKSAAFIVGGKYILKLGRKVKLLLKLEYLYLKINSFNGEKKTGSGIVEGTIYTYDTSPYGIDWFPFWDLHQSEPDDPSIRNVNTLALDLSCLRIMIGFSF